jgi:AcrR family transcriptional regulator
MTTSDTTTSRRGRPRAFDREQALRAAQELIWRHGYEAMSLSQLEAAMGIGKTSLYAAFGSKLDLLREATDLYLAETGAKMRAILEAPGPTMASLRSFFAMLAKDLTDPERPRGCFLVMAAPACARGNEDAIRFVQERRAAVTAILRARLLLGREAGDLTPEADPDLLAGYLMTVIHGLSIQARDNHSQQALQSSCDLALVALSRFATAPNEAYQT